MAKGPEKEDNLRDARDRRDETRRSAMWHENGNVPTDIIVGEGWTVSREGSELLLEFHPSGLKRRSQDNLSSLAWTNRETRCPIDMFLLP